MNNYTDTQLKQALARMLPESIVAKPAIPNGIHLYRIGEEFDDRILDTELLHLCWLVEETLTEQEDQQYYNLTQGYHISWQQRTTALAKMKGIEI